MKQWTEFNRRRWAVQLMWATGLTLLLLAVFPSRPGGVPAARAAPGTLYVDAATGSDDSNCSNPADPCATIGYALTRAGNGDEVLVAAGTYMESLDVHGNPITLRGGYSVNGSTWVRQGGETIVDANGADGPVFDISPENDVTVEGFTVQGANHVSDYGGGFFINGATAVISNTVIRNNSTGGSGGGIYIENTVGAEDASLTLVRSTIVANDSPDSAAGLEVQGGVPMRVTLQNTVFAENIGNNVMGLNARSFEIIGGQVRNNTVTGDVAMYIGGSGTISGTQIISNTPASRVMHIWPGNVVSAHNLTIQGNSGSAIQNRGMLTLTHSLVKNQRESDWFVIGSDNEGAPGTTHLMLDHCTIEGNSDVYGILALGGRADVHATVIANNDTVANNGDVVNIRPGATQVDLVNVLLANNRSARPTLNGNAATCPISLMNVTVAANSVANFPIVAGLGLWTLTNTIVWDNTAPEDMLGGGTFSVSYSDIEGGWPGTGNLDADPRFVDAAGGEYRLGVGSPCVDKGTAVGAPAADIEGTPRDSAPDMGAYEWTGYRAFLPVTVRASGS